MVSTEIEGIIAEMNAMADKVDLAIPEKSAIKPGESRVGTLPPKLRAMYIMYLETGKNVHRTESQIHNAMALEKPDDDIRDLNCIKHRLEEREGILKDLFWHEVRVFINDFEHPSIGVRNDNAIVKRPISLDSLTSGLPDELRKLLSSLGGAPPKETDD